MCLRDFEIKTILNHLKYVFLDENNILLVIIFANLTKDQE